MADNTIAKAYVQIIPTTKGITNTLTSELGGSADAAGESAGNGFGKKLLGALGKIGIGAAVGKMIKDSFSEGAALEQSMGGIETLFETSSKAISAHIKNIGDTTAKSLSDDAWEKLGEDVFKSAGNFKSFKNDVASSMDAVADALSFGVGTALEDQNGYIEMLRKNYKMTAEDAQKMYKSVSASIKKNNDLLPEYASNLASAGDATETMMKNAANAYKTAGLSANEYMETVTSFSASLLQSLGGDTIKAAEYADMAIIDMSDNANKMGSSMESIQNAYQGFAKQNYTMLDNLKLGYGGTAQEMYRLLSDAADLNEEFGKTANFSIDSKGHLEAGYADILQAIHIIQGEMKITGTTAEEASSTVSGSLSQMKAAFQNVLGNIALGEDITPSLQGLMETVSTFFLNNLLPMATNIISALPQAIVTAVTTIAPSIIPAGVELITSLLDGLAIALPELIQTFVDLIPTFVQQIVDGLPQIIESGMNLLMSLIEGIIEAIPQLIEMLPELIETFVQVITDNLPLIIEMGIELTIKLIEGLIQAIPQLVKSAPQLIAALAKGLWEGIKTMGQIGLQLVQGLWQGISDATQWVLEKIRGFGESILEGIKGIFGIHSPSKETAWMGDMLMQGLANGIDNNAKKAVNSMRNAADSALGVVDTDAFGFGGGNYSFSGTSGNVGTNNIVLNVYGAQGQDVRELAEIVMEEIQAATDRRYAAYA